MIADIIVIAIVVVGIIYGYRSGFFKALINIVAYIASIILSFLFHPILSEFLMKTPLYTFFVQKIGENYPKAIALQGGTFLDKYLEKTEGAVSEAIAGFLISIISFVLIVIICKLLINLIAKGLNLFTRLPVLKQFNCMGGAVVGGIIGIVVTYVVMALLVIFTPMNDFEQVTNEIHSSVFAKEMYKNNIILNLVNGEE